jgi:Flp pilus assembly protein TadB
MLLGMGTFFLIAAALTLFVWFIKGDWQPFLTDIVMLAIVITVPTAFYLWNRGAIRRL